MQGQAHVFVRYAPERIPYAITRYTDEVKRSNVLDKQLAKGATTSANDYSIADIAPGPGCGSTSGPTSRSTTSRNLQRWRDRIASVPPSRAASRFRARRPRPRSGSVLEKFRREGKYSDPKPAGFGSGGRWFVWRWWEVATGVSRPAEAGALHCRSRSRRGGASADMSWA
jgi:GST-like protein